MAPTIDLGGKFPHQIAEDDPEIMRLWGEINNAWDDIERLLYSAFDAMLSDETAFATQAVFYSVKAHAGRRDMVESLAKYALLNRPKTAGKLKKAIKRVKARSEDRHSLAHGLWGVGTDLATGESGPVRIALTPEVIPAADSSYSRTRLVEVRNAMKDTAAALRDAIEPIEAAKRTKAEKLMQKHMGLTEALE